ncbi:diguanylate cyclase [Paraburkholderia sp. MMS20-SJTR3]|uniref:Diguanylate cyclase n=1 Tax=Paraburkholderia sejongensis TaxID=2886946 RepID=A0ABS8JZ81_9BURK|nr:diguanylate cyclase [Paraburkholderia sp. MMS20-SJTR3]
MVALVCLQIGLLYLATQVRMVLSDQLRQEYAALVLDAAARADSAREQWAVWQRVPVALAKHDAEFAKGYGEARAAYVRHFASFAALVNASPAPAPHVPLELAATAAMAAAGATAATPRSDAAAASHPQENAARSGAAGTDRSPAAGAGGHPNPSPAPTADAAIVLRGVAAYWRAQRDASSADLRLRVTHVARVLIALAALLFLMLFSALGMYAKRNRQLVGQSHEFEHASLHDALTGLPNRRKLQSALDGAGDAPGSPADARMAVLYVDLDGFKQVNDSYGHRMGDEFLAAVSARFLASVRKSDLVARIGGDEFAVLVPAFSSQAELAEIARRLIACVIDTDEEMGLGLVRASIGIASFPDDVDDHRRLLAVADAAMYEVKRGGKNGYAFATHGGRQAPA